MKHPLVPVMSFVATTLLLIGSVAVLQAAETRPNILVILADDLGYADLGCQGSSDVITPHIDTLAAKGVRCTAGYVTAPLCSPSRAGLLSGQYQQRFGHEGNPNFPLDVLPTALAAAQIKPLEGVSFDGVNLLPFLAGQQPSDPHEALFWRWRAEQAIRMGHWKLVRGREQKAWRLFDLGNDGKEANDLTAKYPGKAKELLTRFEAWNATLPPVGPSFKDPTERPE